MPVAGGLGDLAARLGVAGAFGAGVVVAARAAAGAALRWPHTGLGLLGLRERTRCMRIREALPLGPQRAVHLVAVEGPGQPARLLLIGSTPNAITLLCELAPEFADDPSPARPPASPVADFGGLVRSLMGECEGGDHPLADMLRRAAAALRAGGEG